MESNNAGTAFSSVKPLGGYRLYLDGQSANVHVNVETLRGLQIIVGKCARNVESGLLEFYGSVTVSPRIEEFRHLISPMGPDLGMGECSQHKTRMHLFDRGGV